MTSWAILRYIVGVDLYVLNTFLGSPWGEAECYLKDTLCDCSFSPFLAKHGRGMADLCEQVGEAVHYDTKPLLQGHKVAEDNPRHGER